MTNKMFQALIKDQAKIVLNNSPQQKITLQCVYS